MSFNLTGGNPRAHRIRVYLFGTTVVLEGMPVCYDNSTTNWHGGSMTLGVVTESLTTAEGEQNEGKYIRVELPNADNVSLFAGVVAKGSPGIGKAGPGAIDIYVPNGAVVPVLTDQNCLIDQTILAIQSGEEELGVPVDGDARPVAVARETIDRTTAGLVLAALCPDLFVHQDKGGTALSVDDASTGTASIVNKVHVSFLQQSGNCSAVHVVAEAASGSNPDCYDWGFAGYFQSTWKSGSTIGSATTLGAWMNIDSGAKTVDGGHISAIQCGIYQAGDDPWDQDQVSVAGVQVNLQIEDDPGNNCLTYIRMRNDGAHAIDGIFSFPSTGNCGYVGSSATVNGTIPFLIGGTVYYFIISTTA